VCERDVLHHGADDLACLMINLQHQPQ
jgi:hypothetical protein